MLHAWWSNSTALDSDLAHYISVRTGARNNYGAVRLEMFRGLFESVRRAGGRFDWEHSPILVHPDFSLKDGSHRAALALALGLSHVDIVREGPSWCSESGDDVDRYLRANRRQTRAYVQQHMQGALLQHTLRLAERIWRPTAMQAVEL